MVLGRAKSGFPFGRTSRRSLLSGLAIAGALLSACPCALATDGWVRTRDGWEREESLRPHQVYEPAVHPLVVTSLVTLASLLGLVAFSHWNKSLSENRPPTGRQAHFALGTPQIEPVLDSSRIESNPKPDSKAT
jgi:hypothetical protein